MKEPDQFATSGEDAMIRSMLSEFMNPGNGIEPVRAEKNWFVAA